ncbi:Nif3-like dinuclear metal center hexameric protein [Paenalcaligenes suwonensis]|uniref:Nif3-like dinuclear metal center hexameric protein n=1 Tax=Paenalcaligenes suwonensis TaxID=1202713 RepID=UPI001407F5D9|nr:Nif3-like dinuclear metal center hexameric protein [Paenalcaligenes suwonensis]NHC60126.1 Nif3-like dinuclear metal center hexameric protein [Paenalcaligenes suwonensis]
MSHITRTELEQWLTATLQPHRFSDYCPNGIQVEGRDTIRHIVTGVTASQALLDAAIERGADTVLVHHGWFWKNEDARIRGIKKQRLLTTLQHDLNLFAYHLPLDAHPTLGNNAQLAQVLGLQADVDEEGEPLTCGPGGLIWLGKTIEPHTLESLGALFYKQLQRQPLIVGSPQQRVQKVAWCTGGAQGYMQAALDAGADVYITGEASEPNFHLAHETGSAFIAAGHHATERYGVKALGEAIASRFGIRVDFLDMDNPI